MERAWTLESDRPGYESRLQHFTSCELGQVSLSLKASVSSSVKWGKLSTSKVVLRVKWDNVCKMYTGESTNVNSHPRPKWVSQSYPMCYMLLSQLCLLETLWISYAHNVLSSIVLLSSCWLMPMGFFFEVNPSHIWSSSFPAAFYFL